MTIPLATLAVVLAGTLAPDDKPAGPEATNDARAFDFLLGGWRIHNRRLVGRLRGSTEWHEFEATGECRRLPGGIGNRDEFHTEYWPGFVGVSLRFFDPQARRWAIFWVDNRQGVLQPAVYGTIADGQGIFLGDDVFEGRDIRVRFTWSRTDTPHPRWEQAFSPDGGRTWETNWVMDFARVE